MIVCDLSSSALERNKHVFIALIADLSNTKLIRSAYLNADRVKCMPFRHKFAAPANLKIANHAKVMTDVSFVYTSVSVMFSLCVKKRKIKTNTPTFENVKISQDN